jgi:hypothetical protein
MRLRIAPETADIFIELLWICTLQHAANIFEDRMGRMNLTLCYSEWEGVPIRFASLRSSKSEAVRNNFSFFSFLKFSAVL